MVNFVAATHLMGQKRCRGTPRLPEDSRLVKQRIVWGCLNIFTIKYCRRKDMVSQWCQCPRCGNAHFIKIRPDTRIVNFPAYCKRCKTESLINIAPRAGTVNSKVNWLWRLFCLYWETAVITALFICGWFPHVKQIIVKGDNVEKSGIFQLRICAFQDTNIADRKKGMV